MLNKNQPFGTKYFSSSGLNSWMPSRMIFLLRTSSLMVLLFRIRCFVSASSSACSWSFPT